MRILRAGDPACREFLARVVSRGETCGPSPLREVEASVRAIIEEVRTRGDQALCEYAARFDGASLTPTTLRVDPAEIPAAERALPASAREALTRAAARITAFHQRQLRPSWFVEEGRTVLGQLLRPLESVGLYVPGGRAAYPSTVLMNALPAAVAGVGRIVMCTPVGRDGSVAPAVLVAARLAGVQEIYRVGGAQAIAALAYGTERIPRVDKVVGPGNVYVATAKRLLFGQVGIDMIAGPTEVLIIADSSATPAWIAADLLAQAEHDPSSRALLLTPVPSLAEKVAEELTRQKADLTRREIVEAALAESALIIVEDLLQAAELANQIAPEHLELMIESAWTFLPALKNAGAIFLGGTSPEAVGDYAAGPNHVLPTGGTARFTSPLSVEDFVKKTSLLSVSEATFEELAETVVELATLEGLQAHARSVQIRRER